MATSVFMCAALPSFFVAQKIKRNPLLLLLPLYGNLAQTERWASEGGRKGTSRHIQCKASQCTKCLTHAWKHKCYYVAPIIVFKMWFFFFFNGASYFLCLLLFSQSTSREKIYLAFAICFWAAHSYYIYLHPHLGFFAPKIEGAKEDEGRISVLFWNSVTSSDNSVSYVIWSARYTLLLVFTCILQ